MKTIIAMDSFKGCLSSLDAGNTIKEAILSRYPSDSVEVFPLADGGEGTSPISPGLIRRMATGHRV